ncbi:zinc ABC transporter substrate-binding protein [Hydrogenovibrio kuenenii]|uniref:zinc ABC transporter substrate-binding protein n=1 Tax=Hydrogenovibrio kuenenii TaxID=63658 RepID=UPI0004664C50|nr:zinc ABC transporter substrate-binding protein [Hydrogenovibrio kuenenii]
MNNFFQRLLLSAALLLMIQSAEAARIVVTIPPLLSAIKPLLTSEDQVTVLLTRGQSPHGFSMKPSHALALQRADIIVSVGSGVDQWAQKTIHNVERTHPVEVVTMTDIPNVTLIEGGHDEHHDGELHHDDDEVLMGINPHLWLDMDNIEKLVAVFSQALQKTDVAQAQEIAVKTKTWIAKLKATDNHIQQQLEPVKKVPYLVFHNAFVYFEKRYGLDNKGALHNSAERKAGVKRLVSVDDMIQNNQVKCVFQEPQLSNKQLTGLIKGSKVRLGTLDPLGDGSMDSAQFMQSLANQYLNCLAGKK